MVNSRGFGLGRNEEFDEESRNFPIRALVAGLEPRSYTWRCTPRLNQGQDGTCVAAAWLADFAARPAERPVTNYMIRPTYKEIVLHDQWPQNDGPDYNFGSSTLAAAKLFKLYGWITEYRWCFNVNDVRLAIGYEGPVLAGIPWYDSMFDPDAYGFVSVGGQQVGGHEILLNGYNVSKDAYRIHNSWGPEWGINGEAFIKGVDLARLLAEGGDACVPMGRR